MKDLRNEFRQDDWFFLTGRMIGQLEGQARKQTFEPKGYRAEICARIVETSMHDRVECMQMVSKGLKIGRKNSGAEVGS